ncbi:phosphatase PAP2 family protein [Salinisphaera sp. T31B1]|uniref:phosphatase PAP2 family protein n=1 Tax=Salinisphaera sp. T31B1 TaxID=727963 RepID=UPI0033420EE3
MVVTDRDWHLPGLFWSYGLAAVLVFSFLAPATRELWNSLDIGLAYGFNSWVASNALAQRLWAVANLRVIDYIAAIFLCSLLLCYGLFGRNAWALERAARLIVLCAALLAVVALTRAFVFDDISRDSPSLVLEPFTRLSEQVDFAVKDHSPKSFPGDHATVVAVFTFLLWFFAGPRYGLVSALLAALLVLPRLVSGAHWTTDVVVGGVGTALVTVPMVIFTPLQLYAVAWTAKGLNRIVCRCALFSSRSGPTGPGRERARPGNGSRTP